MGGNCNGVQLGGSERSKDTISPLPRSAEPLVSQALRVRRAVANRQRTRVLESWQGSLESTAPEHGENEPENGRFTAWNHDNLSRPVD